MTDQEIINKNRKRVNKEIKDFNDDFDEKYMTPDEKNEKFIDELVKLVSSHPEIEERVIAEYNKKKSKKRKKVSIKVLPYIVAGGLALGAIGGSLVQKKRDENTTISFNPTYEARYDSIEDAPLEVKKAYVEDQIDKYQAAVSEKPELADKTLDESIQNYESSTYGENNLLTNYDDIFTSISNQTITDPVKETVPFGNSPYSRSFVGDDGYVYVPVDDGSQITEEDILKTNNGSLYKRGR